MPATVAVTRNILQSKRGIADVVTSRVVQLSLHLFMVAPLITSGAESLGHGVLFFL